MKVSFYNLGRKVVTGFNGCNDIGKMVLEIETDTEAERSIFRGLEQNEKDFRIAISSEGNVMSVYLPTSDKKGE